MSCSQLPPIYPPATPDWAKVSSFVSREDWQLINSLAAQSGAVSFIIDHAIKSTADAIRSHGLTPIIDTPRFFLWLRERSFSEPPTTAQGQAGDDSGRVKGARQSTKAAADVATGARPDVEKRRGTRRGKASAGET